MTKSDWRPRILWSALGFNPHPDQEKVLHQVHMALFEGGPRFMDCTTGRQWGKTTEAEVMIWTAALAPNDPFGPPVVKIVADTYEHGRLIWDKVVGHAYGTELLKPLVSKFDKERELLTLTTGATIQLLSSDRPQGLTGFTITFVLFDESAFISDAAVEMMMPCLAVRQGVAVAFGTAEGQGWHRTWFLRGQDENYKDNWSATFPSTSNPYFPMEELEVQRVLLPRRRFEQLYLAMWQSEEGAVFHNLDNCIMDRAPLTQEPEPNRKYLVGCDFGRHQDFTVAYIGDSRTGRVLHQERFTQLEWMSQIERVAELCKKYNGATLVADATGLGDVVIAALQAVGVDVVKYVFTSSSKDRLIQKLVVALEREELRFPPYPELLRELRVYETRTLPSGRQQTGAPPGFHDDCIMALALLNEGMERGYGSSERSADEFFGWEAY